MREFNALIKADTIPLTNYILDGKFSNNKVENSENDAGSEKMVFNPLASGGDALPIDLVSFDGSCEQSEVEINFVIVVVLFQSPLP